MRSSMSEAHVQTEPIAQLFPSRNAHFGTHRHYDLKTQLSLLPQFGHSKIRPSMPSSSGATRAKFIGVEHFGQAGRKLYAEYGPSRYHQSDNRRCHGGVGVF